MPNTLKLIKKAQEPQLEEDEKVVAYIRGFSANEKISQVMKDIYMMKKPIGVLLNKRNIIKPFEDVEPIEFICRKNDCSLFLFTSHSKKRPLNLVMGRLYNGHILDMVEFGVEMYKAIQDFAARISLGVKPVLIFTGEPFESDFDMIRIKNLLNDFFLGPRPKYIRVKGIEHVIMFVADGCKVYIRPYLIEQKRTPGSSNVVAECHEMGPQLDLVVRRTKLANHDQFTEACKQKPKQPKSARNKNIIKDDLGATNARVHINAQDFSKMHTVKY